MTPVAVTLTIVAVAGCLFVAYALCKVAADSDGWDDVTDPDDENLWAEFYGEEVD